jgi:hypothetical protein
MDEQVLAKVKECALSYLGAQSNDFVSVAEIFNDEQTQGFDVRVQGKELPSTAKCFVVVKEGQASIVAQPGASSSTQ